MVHRADLQTILLDAVRSNSAIRIVMGRTVEEVTSDERGLTANDLVAIIRVLVNWSIMAAAVWIATAVVPGIEVSGGVATYLAVSVLFGLGRRRPDERRALPLTLLCAAAGAALVAGQDTVGAVALLGCFAGGVPTIPVRRGELQARALGMAVEAWDEQRRPVIGQRDHHIVR